MPHPAPHSLVDDEDYPIYWERDKDQDYDSEELPGMEEEEEEEFYFH